MIRRIQAFDLRTFQSVFNSTRHSTLETLARVVSRTADGWLYPLILLPLILLMKPGQVLDHVTLAILGFSIERSLYYSLKKTCRRKRPYRAIKGFKSIILAADEFSLPSGHTSAAFFFVTFLCAGFSLLFLPLYLWATAVGASRVILGVHFMTDILIGAVIGSCIALLMI